VTASADSTIPGRPARPGVLRGLELAALLAAAAIVGYQVFFHPIVGLADEGDFVKVADPIGLRCAVEPDFDRYFHYVNLDWQIGPRSPAVFWSSELLLVEAARLLSTGLAPSGIFDLRALGAVHAAIFLAAIGLLLRAGRRLRAPARLVFALLLVFFFTDVGYVALFNSFYTATASLLGLLLLAGATALLAASPAPGPILSAAYWGAALFFVTSKPQESVQAPALALLALALASRGRGPGRPRAVLLLGLLLCAAAAISYRALPSAQRDTALFNTVFRDLLARSSDPRADLLELGLPPDWARYAGSNAFAPDSPFRRAEIQSRFLDSVSYRKVLLFYLRHPARPARLLQEGAARAFRLRPRYLGNFTKDSGARPTEKSRAFAVWSDARAKLSPLGPWLLPALWGANLAAALALWRRQTAEESCAGAALAVLVLLSITAFLVCALAEGLPDLARHLHAFNAMTDLTLLADAVGIVSWLAAVRVGRAARTGAVTAG
jgi:hypothetical protein